MAKDPAFLFYPGDYLKDTQCLSEKAQVAYDRIMCEHMRNICEHMSNITVSKVSLNFFTKRLSEDEKSELMRVLQKSGDGFQIDWVAESISKRKSYTNSRAQNRTKKPKNISSSYDEHMENANENENTNKNVVGIEDWKSIKTNFLNSYVWQEKFCRDKGVLLPALKIKMNEFISDVELKEDYKNLKELKSHFTNLFNKQKNGFKLTQRGANRPGTDQMVAILKQGYAAGRKENP